MKEKLTEQKIRRLCFYLQVEEDKKNKTNKIIFKDNPAFVYNEFKETNEEIWDSLDESQKNIVLEENNRLLSGQEGEDWYLYIIKNYQTTTVAELIEKLKTFPPEVLVVYPGFNFHYMPIRFVEPRTFKIEDNYLWWGEDNKELNESGSIEVVLIDGDFRWDEEGYDIK
jgi:hypothetical protein